MGVTPMWKIRLILLRASLMAWLRNLFSTRAARQERYRCDVAETAFEFWMGGGEFEKLIMHHISNAQRERNKRAEVYWLDVLEEAREYEEYPENLRVRDGSGGPLQQDGQEPMIALSGNI